MKRQMILAVALLTLAVPCFGQNHADVVAVTKALLAAKGMNLSGACGAAQITVRVAYQLRDQGYKLLVKQAGNRAIFQADGSCLTDQQSNAPGFATDYLISMNEGGVGYDLLGDGGGANIPQWLGPENAQDMVLRNLQSHADAPNLDPPVVPPPPPPPVIILPPAPAPAPPPPQIILPSNAELIALIERILDNQRQALEVAKDTNVRVASMDRTLTQTLGSFGKFLGKYVAPALAGWYIAHATQGEQPPAEPAPAK